MSVLINTAQAATAAGDTTAAFGAVVSPIITNVVQPVVELAFAVAVVAFVYGVIQLIIHKTDADKHEQGKNAVIYGIVGIVLMLSAWGIIRLVANTVAGFK